MYQPQPPYVYPPPLAQAQQPPQAPYPVFSGHYNMPYNSGSYANGPYPPPYHGQQASSGSNQTLQNPPQPQPSYFPPPNGHTSPAPMILPSTNHQPQMYPYPVQPYPPPPHFYSPTVYAHQPSQPPLLQHHQQGSSSPRFQYTRPHPGIGGGGGTPISRHSPGFLPRPSLGASSSSPAHLDLSIGNMVSNPTDLPSPVTVSSLGREDTYGRRAPIPAPQRARVSMNSRPNTATPSQSRPPSASPAISDDIGRPITQESPVGQMTDTLRAVTQPKIDRAEESISHESTTTLPSLDTVITFGYISVPSFPSSVPPFHLLSTHPDNYTSSTSLFISRLAHPPEELSLLATPLTPHVLSQVSLRKRPVKQVKLAKDRRIASFSRGRLIGAESEISDGIMSTTGNLTNESIPIRSDEGVNALSASSNIPSVPLPEPTKSDTTALVTADPRTPPMGSDHVDALISDVSALGAENKGDDTELPEAPTITTKKAPVVAPLTKSFASLLRGSSGGSTPSRMPDSTSSNVARENHSLASGYDHSAAQDLQARVAILPSAQVGFSLPAMGSEDLSIVLSPHQHANLLQLFKAGTNLIPGVANSMSTGDVTGKRPVILPRGLVNTGNICFANAILQALVYTPPFWKLFTELDKFAPFNNHTTPKGREAATPIVNAIIAFLAEFKPKKDPGTVDPDSFPLPLAASTAGSNGKPVPVKRQQNTSRDPSLLPRDSFTASNLYNSLKSNSRFDAMRLGQQEDAEEFLGFFLDALHEELVVLLRAFGGENGSATPKGTNGDSQSWQGSEVDQHQEDSNNVSDEWQEVGRKNRAVLTRTMKSSESAITTIFGGKFRSVLRASGRPDSASVEEWRCLQLDIQPQHVQTIEDALYSLSAIETVSIQNRHGVPAEATKQMLIEQLPPVLVLHLKRFIYDPASGIGKNTKAIRYGPELVIRNELMSPAMRRERPLCKYQLYGVVYHHGLAATGGHYTLDVLHPNPTIYMKDTSTTGPDSATSTSTATQEGWLRFNDETVRRLTRDEVFRRSAPPSGNFALHEQDDQTAYLLFYRRITK